MSATSSVSWKSRWDEIDAVTSAVALLACAMLAGFFLGRGDFDTAWHFGVLWVLVLIANTLRALLDAVKGDA
jgi:hypothetical protein